MNNYFDCIIEPIKTEKASIQEKDGKYFFKVSPTATKNTIKTAVEKIFNVHVVAVNTQRYIGKLKRVRYQPGYQSDWKKAIVTLKKGEKLNLA